MTDQQQNPEPADDEVTVGFTFHNPTGDGDTVLSTPLLGADLYILVQPGENGPVVESSHMTPDEAAGALTIVLAALLQANEVSDDVRTDLYDLLDDGR